MKKSIVLVTACIVPALYADELTEITINSSGQETITRGFERDLPRKYIERAIGEFTKRNGSIIVEIGSPRMQLPHSADASECMLQQACLEGHSAAFWALTGKAVYSVDISSESIQITQEMCKDFPNVQVVQQDGIEFLKAFDQPIDLLYLDAWDVGSEDFAEKHLEAYLVAKKNLHEKSIILIDDTDFFNNFGKGRYVVPEAIKDGYKLIFQGRQTMLMKE
jgi:hypothetical protein